MLKNKKPIAQHLFFWLSTLLVIVVLSHLPNKNLPLSSDDFIWNAHILGSEQLFNLGFGIDNPEKTFWQKVQHGFLFYNDQNSSLNEQRNYGNLPWWSATEGRLNPFRPIASAMLWLDHQLFSKAQLNAQWLSRLYFIFFVFSAFLFYHGINQHTESASPKPSNSSSSSPSSSTSENSLAIISFLATLFLLFDLSVTANLLWLAARNSYASCAFALCAFYFHLKTRENDKTLLYIPALFTYLLALLTAEAAVSMFAYFVAYAWIKDKRGFVIGSISIVPYFLLIILWRLAYNHLNFGAVGNGLYTDPGQNLFGFVIRLYEVLPIIFTSVVTGVDGSIQGLAVEYRNTLLFCSLIFSLLVVSSLRKIIFSNKTTLFLFVGSLIAMVPHTALLSVTSRSGVFAAIGFFYILAVCVSHLLGHYVEGIDQKPKNKLHTFSAYLILSYHLFLPALFCILLFSGGVHFADRGNGDYGDIGPQLEENSNRQLIFINHPAPDHLLYFPFLWDYEQKILPNKIQALAPGLSSFTLTRTKERTLLLSAKNHFVLKQNTPMASPKTLSEGLLHRAYKNRFNEALITHSTIGYSSNQVIQGAGIEITIKELVGDKVKIFEVKFLDADRLEDKIWQQFSWSTQGYSQITAPKIGETIYFPGPFDPVSKPAN